MSKTPCRLCRNARILLLSALMGGAGGFGVVLLGGSAGLSMAATFLGAIGPLMWYARHTRDAGRR